jgi:hypothetical protein
MSISSPRINQDAAKNEDSLYDWKYDPNNKLVLSQAGNIGYDKSGNEYKINPETNQFEQTEVSHRLDHLYMQNIQRMNLPLIFFRN